MFKLISVTQIRCVAKEFFCCNFYGTRLKQTFQNQIQKYFENISSKHKSYQQFEISTQIKKNIPEFKKVKQKLFSIYEDLNCLSNISNHQVLKKKKFIDVLDTKCLTIVNVLEYPDILSLLNAILKVIPSNIMTNLKFYNNAILQLLEAAENGLLSNHEKVQLLFFVSIMKEEGVKHIKFLKDYLPELEELPLIEKSIVAQSFYRLSLKLTKEESRLLEKIIEVECDKLIHDQLSLVSFCKAIRISGPSDELILTNLSRAVAKSYKSFNFSSLVHILCLYADALIFDEEMVTKTVSHCLKMIENDSQSKSLRLKDIDRFLWSTSYLGFVLSNEQKEILKNYIEHRIKDYKSKENLGIFVNSILSSHMLQCWNLKVIDLCFKECIFEPVFLKNFHWKVKARLQLLITQITLELKINVPKILRKQIKISYTVSENIETVSKIASLLMHEGIVINAFVESPIRTLQIPGITLVTENSNYHIDILDNSTCLKNSNLPHGLMKLKLRLLSQMKYHQILVNANIFKENSSQAQSVVRELILKEINI